MALSEQEGIPSLEEAHGSLNLVQLRSLCQAPDLHLEELQNLSLLRVCVCVHVLPSNPLAILVTHLWTKIFI